MCNFGKRNCADGCCDTGCVEHPSNKFPAPIKLVDRKPPSDPLADFYGKIRDTAKLTDGITLAERIAVLDVVRAELVASFQAKIDDAEIDEA